MLVYIRRPLHDEDSDLSHHEAGHLRSCIRTALVYTRRPVCVDSYTRHMDIYEPHAVESDLGHHEAAGTALLRGLEHQPNL